MEALYDVAIIGGGPSGSSAATTLAKQGHKVIVLEREKFPRFHIGESLLPHSMEAFKRLGVLEKLDARFVHKYGAEISTACGTNVVKIFFQKGLKPCHEYAYQVTRSEFDKLLLDNSRENGAEVREETFVEHLDFGAEEIGITLKDEKNGSTQKIRARYLLDCSGRNAVVGQYFKLKRNYETLKKFSVFAHYENVTRAEGKEGGNIRIIRAHDRWFWMIPLSPTKMSIGYVMDIADFKAAKKSPEVSLEESLREYPTIWNTMTNATRVTEVYSASDYSYRNTSLIGERWMLAGDAAGFIDPVFSTGVFLGIRSGEEAAEALHTALKNPAQRASAFSRYERSVNRVMDLYLRFVNNWYKPHFGEIITHPVDKLSIPATVNTVLAGNLSNSFSIWWRMQIFYFIVFLQKYLPVCPRVPSQRKPVPSAMA
ncbi:MAG TPA: NAD(P)/FAD-dependent oxidoreductase [Verrucomicrobiae bacterium]